MVPLRIYLFGNMRLELNEQKVESQVPRPVRKLLAYLLLHPSRTHLRDALADRLWGESEPDKARGSLNTAIWHLRKVLEPKNISGGTYLITNHNGEIGINQHNAHWLDVREFSTKVNQIMAHRIDEISPDQIRHLVSALELYNGDLLEGFYDDWIIQEREHLRMLYLKAQAYLMDYHKKHSQLEEGIACAQKIIEMDPLREEIHRELMRLFMMNGQRSFAIRQYEVCKDLLKVELGVEPMPETRLLSHQLSGQVAPQFGHSLSDRVKDIKEIVDLLQLALQAHELTREQIQKAISYLEEFSTPYADARTLGDKMPSRSRKT